MKKVLMGGGASAIALGGVAGAVGLLSDNEAAWRVGVLLLLVGIGATLLVALVNDRSIKSDTAMTRDRSQRAASDLRDVAGRLREINNREKLVEGRTRAIDERGKTIDASLRSAATRSLEFESMLTAHAESIDRVRSDNRALHELLLANVIENRSQISGDALRKRIDQRFQQIESLLALYALLESRTAVPPLGGWSASPDLCRFVVDQILSSEPVGIVELGSGASTVLMAAAAKTAGSGHVVAFEHLEECARSTTDMLKDADLEAWATVHVVPLEDVTIDREPMTWYAIDDADLPPTIDLLFIDGPPASTGPLARLPAMERLHDRLADGALTVLDDAHRPSEAETIERWVSAYEDLDVEILDHEKGTAAIWRRTPDTGNPGT